MMRNGVSDYFGSPKPVRIVVAGETGTGKSSLIIAAVDGFINPNIPPVLPNINVPPEFFPERIPGTIVDTSSRVEDMAEVIEELKKADVVVLTFACDRRRTLGRLSNYWLPLLRELEVKVPVVLAGFKAGFEWVYNRTDITQVTTPIMNQFREIEMSCKWSSQMLYDIPWRAQEIFTFAHSAALYPLQPIYDDQTKLLKPRCVAALRRVFLISGHTRDCVLTDADLNFIQLKCFHKSMMPYECEELRRIVQQWCPYGVNERGITWSGFLCLHKNFVVKGNVRILWKVLRTYGYTNELRLRDDLIPYESIKREADQSVELTYEAVSYLCEVYEHLDEDGDNHVGRRRMGNVFQTTPDCLLNTAPYKYAVELYEDGGLSLEAFLSLWALMTLLEPARTLEYLICIKYPYDSALAVAVTRKRSLDLKEKICEREVVQCFVFGPRKAGKTALLNRFTGRPYNSRVVNEPTEEGYAVNVVDVFGEKRVLVLKEMQIQEDGLSLSNEALAACNVAIFVYDSSDKSSWNKSIELLSEVATLSKETGFEFPCLMVAAKCDLDSFPREVQEATKVTKDLGIGTPIPVSSKFDNLNDVFKEISIAAEQPHKSIPEIKPKKEESSRLFNKPLAALLVGTGALIAGLATFRFFAARKHRNFFG